MGRFGFGVLSWRNKQCSVSKPKYQLDQIFIELVSVELDSQYNKFGSQQRHIVLTEAMLPVRKWQWERGGSVDENVKLKIEKR